MTSIRRRLLWRLCGGIGALLVAAGAAVFVEIRDEVGELFDAQLQQAAYAFPQGAPGGGAFPPPAASGQEADDRPLRGLVVEVRRADGGEPVYYSQRRAVLPERPPPGWSTITIGGQRWRVYGLERNGWRIAVGQPLAVRAQAADEIAVQVLLPLAAALPLAGALLWFGIGRGLRPLERTAAEIRRRSHTDLRPLPRGALPAELAPLADALDELMARLAAALAAQKHFVADAAHELQTPLTALRLQAQLLARAGTQAERAAALDELRAGIERGIHLVRQLLTLARQAPERPPARERVDLVTLTHEAAAAQAAAARARRIELQVAPTPAVVEGEGESLRILLANLLDNAIKYTPAGGRVVLGANADEEGCSLWVEDSGPGIPEAERARVCDRFYRIPGNEASGSGLGLAIATEIARRHRAELSLARSVALGGLRAQVRFPRPAAHSTAR
jgi:signal transduction histidine kinase